MAFTSSSTRHITRRGAKLSTFCHHQRRAFHHPIIRHIPTPFSSRFSSSPNSMIPTTSFQLHHFHHSSSVQKNKSPSSSSFYQKDQIHLDKLSEAEYQEYLSVCKDHLKLINREQYLMVKYLPNQTLQTLAILLHNINAELSHVKSAAKRNEAGGELRLQWWNDALKDCINGTPPRVPVLIVLSACIKRMQREGIQIPWWTFLRRMIHSKKQDLSWSSQPPTLETLERYADASYGSILSILLASQGIRDQYAENVAAHVGCAFGLSLLLRGTIHHAKQQTTYLPADVCAKHGVSEQDIYMGRKREEISNVVFDVAQSSFAHLKQAREKQSKINVTPEIMNTIGPIFYPSILCEVILKRLEKNNFDVYSCRMEPDDVLLSFSTRLFWKQYIASRKI